MYTFFYVPVFGNRGGVYVPLFVFILLTLELLEKEVCYGLAPTLSRCSNYKSFLIESALGISFVWAAPFCIEME